MYCYLLLASLPSLMRMQAPKAALCFDFTATSLLPRDVPGIPWIQCVE